MTNPLEIPELVCMIADYLDLKSIGRIIQVNQTTNIFVRNMPIYVELLICFASMTKINDLYPTENDYTLQQKIFIHACGNSCWNIIHNILNKSHISSEINLALLRACENGYLDIVKYLVEHDANIHAWNDLALRQACHNGHFSIVKYLVEEGANIHAENDSALRFSSERGHLDIVKYLVEEGANIHAENDSALRFSSERGHLDIVKFLISMGANVEDHEGLLYRIQWW